MATKKATTSEKEPAPLAKEEGESRDDDLEDRSPVLPAPVPKPDVSSSPGPTVVKGAAACDPNAVAPSRDPEKLDALSWAIATFRAKEAPRCAMFARWVAKQGGPRTRTPAEWEELLKEFKSAKVK